MGYGIEHTAELPVVGVTPRTTWAEQLLAVLDEIRTTLDAKVTPAGMDINAPLSFRSGASYYGAVELAYVSLHGAVAPAAADYPGALFKNTDGELYYNDDSGNAVALTAGGSVAAAAGNLTSMSGDAAVTWVAADATYEFTEEAGVYADLKCDDVLLSDGSSNFLRLAAPSMSGDYTLTFPAAAPGSNSNVLAMTTLGAITITSTPTVSTLTATTSLTSSGPVTVGTSLNVGTTTSLGGTTTLAVNKNLVMSGTGYIKHGTRLLYIPAHGWNPSTSSTAVSYSANALLRQNGSGAVNFVAPISLPVGSRVLSLNFRGLHGINGSDRTYGFYSRSTSLGAITTIASDTDTTNNDATLVQLTSINETITDSRFYWVEMTTQTVASDGIYGVTVEYDVP